MKSRNPGRRRGVLVGAIALFALALGAPTVLTAWADEGHDHGGSSQRLQKGVALIESRALFVANCATCHGERGRGATDGVGDFSDPQALIELTPDHMRSVLANRHEGRLPAELGERDRDAILDYVRNYLMLPAPDADAELGRSIYAQTCSVCHGDRGDGASWAKNSLYPGPVDFTTHGLDQLTREKMIEVVTFGSPRTAMVAFATQLSRDEVAATVDYIRGAFMPERGTAEHRGHDHSGRTNDSPADAGHHTGSEAHQGGHGAEPETFPGGLAGDPAWGKEFYQANCAECHGEKGDGNGRRAYFMIIKPKDFLSRAARADYDRAKLFEKISDGVVGATMPAWSKVLDAQEIANVGEYVYRAFLHPEKYSDVNDATPIWRPSETAAPGGAKKN